MSAALNASSLDTSKVGHCAAGKRSVAISTLRASNKSVSGERRGETLAIYTEGANQKKLADSAITALARWEMRFRAGDETDEYRFTAND